jgi:peptidyl-prolyl cis-trans isomerase SurA
MMPLAESAWPETGKCSAPQRNPLDGSYSFMCMLEKGAKGGIRSFEQAKGYVISDYQEALEKIWLDSIRKKYPVKVNQAVWKQVLSAR